MSIHRPDFGGNRNSMGSTVDSAPGRGSRSFIESYLWDTLEQHPGFGALPVGLQRWAFDAMKGWVMEEDDPTVAKDGVEIKDEIYRRIGLDPTERKALR